MINMINFSFIYLNNWHILVLNSILKINLDCDILYVHVYFY